MNYTIEDTDLDHMDRLIDYYNDVRAQEGFQTAWSLWRSDEWQDMNDISGIPEGTVIRYWDHFGNDFRAQVKGKTWLDVWRACDEVIVESGDTFHNFIEDLSWTVITQEDGTVEMFLDLVTGC